MDDVKLTFLEFILKNDFKKYKTSIELDKNFLKTYENLIINNLEKNFFEVEVNLISKILVSYLTMFLHCLKLDKFKGVVVVESKYFGKYRQFFEKDFNDFLSSINYKNFSVTDFSINYTNNCLIYLRTESNYELIKDSDLTIFTTEVKLKSKLETFKEKNKVILLK